MGRPSKKVNVGKQSESPRILKFFKVFNAATYSIQLHIPTAYTLYMQGNLPDRAVLRDRFGNMWRVELSRVGNEWYFQEGWAKVVQDNAIEHGDILVFLFDGDKSFNFKIIGRNSCEKDGVGSLKFKLDEEEKGEEEGEDQEGEEGEEKEENPITLKSKHSGSPSRKFSGEKNGQEGASASHGNRTIASASHGKRIRDTSDLFGASIFKSGVHAQPRNPYFVTKIRLDRPNPLYVPFEVFEAFNLIHLPPKMTLRDPHGRTWLAKLRTWKDGRMFYTGGWKQLCMKNSINEEDKCVCEFMPQRGRALPVMQIQIFRKDNAPET